MHSPLITAHSGCEQTSRDSMDSVECAIALGADVVEMDIRKAPDRVLRVSHNCVSSEEYAGKPQLKEVFRLICDKGLALNCDIKESHALYDVLDLAEAFAFGPDRLFLSGSVSPEQLARDASITQRAGVYLNIEEILKFLSVGHLFQDHTESRFPELMNTPWNFVRGVPLEGEVLTSVITLLKTLGVRGLNLPHGMVTPMAAERLNTAEIPFSVWTVNKPELIEQCLRVKAANVTTLTVESALNCRRQIFGF